MIFTFTFYLCIGIRRTKRDQTAVVVRAPASDTRRQFSCLPVTLSMAVIKFREKKLSSDFFFIFPLLASDGVKISYQANMVGDSAFSMCVSVTIGCC